MIESIELCQLRMIIDKTRNQLKLRQGMKELKVAIGHAVPAIEAWISWEKNTRSEKPLGKSA